MKIALLGYGKMGKMVEQLAVAQGDQIVCRISTSQNEWSRVEEADICIDFSHASAVIAHLQESALRHKNLVIGTTGWESSLEEAKTIIDRQGIGVLYAPNFSLGMHLFLKILEQSAHLMNPFQEYDVAGIEIHHAQKKDTPSGTALEISRRLKKSMDRVAPIEMAALRVGSVPGKHCVFFSSPFDTISISHEAHSREGFARGALKAADWLIGKKGFYTLEELFHAP
jgi:4-hydroxy-tetrahydrodipicolinate reductase